MSKFKSVVRSKKKDGLHPVYIRIYHNKNLQYIKTGLIVNKTGLKDVYDKNGKKSLEISDRIVIRECLSLIEKYVKKMNLIDAGNMDCKTLVEVLANNNTELSFTEYAYNFIKDMYIEGRGNSAKNYKSAISSLHNYISKSNILFNHLTSRVIAGWIDTMKDSARKKSLYPSCVRCIFNSATRRYNDYDYNIVPIRVNPFAKVKIPKENTPQKRSIPALVMQQFILSSVEYSKGSRKELGHDVGMIIFCLAGINAADLYDLKKTSLVIKDWKLCYNRKKTRDKSDTNAYMEITVPDIIRPLFKKYKSNKNALFNFSDRFSNPNDFVKYVNKGLKAVCEEVGIPEKITTYTFRHTWATIAQNECKANTEQVAFALNHSSAHKVTESYIRKDYRIVDELNEKVISFVLNKK